MNNYVTKEQLDKACNEINDRIDDIKDNHLNSIWAYIGFLDRSIGNLRWWIMGSVAVLGIVLAIIQVFG